MMKLIFAIAALFFVYTAYASSGTVYTDATRSYDGFAGSFSYSASSQKDPYYTCGNIGEVGGCSACQATTGNCAWVDTQTSNDYPQCVPVSFLDVGGVIDQYNEGKLLARQYRHAPEQCPTDPNKAVHLIIREDPSGNGYDNSHREVIFPIAVGNGDGFCEFPYEPYITDRLNFANWQGDLYEHDGRLVLNAPNSCLQALHAMVPRNWNEYSDSFINNFVNSVNPRDKEELKSAVSAHCVSSQNPLSSERGKECIRRMQAAYCSQYCSEYGRGRGFFCESEREAIYQICAPWTAGWEYYSGEPLGNDCPLDPNNLFWDFSNEAYCDHELTRIRGSQSFETAFGLYEELED